MSYLTRGATSTLLKKNLCLLNPSYILSYHITSFISRYTPRHDHILMATTLGKCSVILAVTNDVGGWCEYHLFHSGIDGWLMHSHEEQAWRVQDGRTLP